MALLVYGKLFDSSISTTSATVLYTPADWNERLAVAEQFSAEMRGTQGNGSSPSVKAELETSNDGVWWSTRSAIIPTTALGVKATVLAWGQDNGSSVVGRYLRMKVTLTSTGAASAYVEIWLAGRSND